MPVASSVPQTEGDRLRQLPAAMSDRLIVGLDLPSVEAAREMIARLDGVVSFFKVGLWLLFAPGAEALIDRDLIGRGKRVFLDAKMYDIGETVRRGVERVTARGVSIVTVHGDEEIMRAAADGRGDSTLTKVFAISVLTSLDDAGLKAMGYTMDADTLIRARARAAVECGCDGLIASARDVPHALRVAAGNDDLLIATPGIRPSGLGADDHKRPATPAEAIRNGADYLVVARPIVAAPDPLAAARAIITEMECA